jgi:predicted Zn-dependent peptidase
MLGGTEPSRIMCLTFTKAAAAEMANRLFDRLSKWIALDDDALRAELKKLGSPDADDHLLARARQLFTRALETPGGRVEQLARQVLTFGRVIPRDEIAARIDAVTAQDVRAAALDVLASPPTLAMVGPKIKAADLKLADLTASGAH